MIRGLLLVSSCAAAVVLAPAAATAETVSSAKPQRCLVPTGISFIDAICEAKKAIKQKKFDLIFGDHDSNVITPPVALGPDGKPLTIVIGPDGRPLYMWLSPDGPVVYHPAGTYSQKAY